MIDISRDLPPLGHGGYVVASVEGEAEKYRRALCIADFRIYDFVPGKAWPDGTELEECALRIAIGNFRDGVKIELIQPVADQTPHARFLTEAGPGLHHVCFSVPNYDEWLAWYRAGGAGSSSKPKRKMRRLDTGGASTRTWREWLVSWKYRKSIEGETGNEWTTGRQDRHRDGGKPRDR